MEYKKSMIIIMLAIFLLSIAGVCASDANDMAIASEDTTPIEMVQSDEISVNDNNQAIGQSNDEEIISEGNAGTFSELQNNITAMTGPTLELDRNYVYDDGFDTSGIKIDKKITIDGKGYTIDAQGKSRVFNIEASDVTIKNLTIKNANYDGDGGAVYFAQSGRAINCNFTNNKATGDDSVGGAIYMYSGTVENCNFTNNKATAFDSEGGAICMYSGTVTNCNFTNCSVTGEYSCGGAICFTSEGNVTNCNFVNNAASYGDAGAVYFSSGGAVTNCNFINNTATSISFDGTGGAIVFVGTATVTNCNFVNNTAFKAGAIYIFSGTVTNCNFTNNSAEYSGGAVFFMNYGNVENCNFTDNKATMGSAIYFYKEYSTDTLTISNSTFLNNRANVDDDTPLNVIINENNITITFMGQNNLLNAIYSCEDAEVTFNNVTYWGANGITTISSTNPESINEAGQNITVGVVVNDKLVLNDVKVTDENGAIVLDVKVDGDYYISVRHDEDSYYTEAKTVITNMKFYVNVTETKTTNKTVNITAKSNIIKNEVISGKLLFVLPNGVEINATYASNGIWWAVYTFDDYGDYQVNASYSGLDNVTINNATISITKAKTQITASEVNTIYNIDKDLVITLKDSTGKPLSGASVTVDFNGVKTYITDADGRVKVTIKGLAPKTYTAKISFDGNADYIGSSAEVNVIVKKATPKLTAKKKAFRKAKKTKKYTITLKDNTGRAMKKAKVTLKVKGKTYKATTNSKGKATFKIKNLKKKGKYTAVITYKGDKFYNKVTKKVKITIK